MPSYQNAVEGHPDPSTISIQPDDVVQLDGTGPRNRTIESVQAQTVEVRLNPSSTLEGVAIARVWLVQPVGLTPEELERELVDEDFEKTERALWREIQNRGGGEAEYLQAKLDGTNLPDPPDRPR